jgi:hypothetical protein
MSDIQSYEAREESRLEREFRADAQTTQPFGKSYNNTRRYRRAATAAPPSTSTARTGDGGGRCNKRPD